MAQVKFDLISMADIARLAGQSRATVGNWKSRNPEEFPPERGRSSRGPLYDRAEVTAWLEATNRLDKRPPEVDAMWQLAGQLRDGMKTEDAMALLLLLLAVMSKSHKSEWQRLVESPPNDLDSTFRATALALFPFADEVLPSGKLPNQWVAGTIRTLSNMDRLRFGVMADALLEQAANAMRHRGGEFLIPPSVRRLVTAIAEPAGTVYNPATGIGQLMIEAATSAVSQPVHLVGQEANARIWAMLQLNLAIHDVTADVALGDVFSEDRYPQLLADRVISVPPWNQRLPIADVLTDDPRWVWGEPGRNDGNAAWIQHCLSHLADDGRAVIVLPNGALFEGGRAGRIRQRVVKAGLLDAVLALPPGLFPATTVPCAVLVFAKGRPKVDGKPAPTLMIDVNELTGEHPGRAATLNDNVIDEVAALYRRWVDGQPPTADCAAVAAFDELAANDFVIDPGRYLSLPHIAPDLEKATQQRADLVDRLESLTRTSRDAAAKLMTIGNSPMTTFREIRLGELAGALTITRGFPTQRAEPEGDVRVMSVAALRNAASPKSFADSMDIADLGMGVAQTGDILVAIEGGTIGETLVVHSDMDVFVPSQQAVTLRVVDSTTLDPWYLGAWLASEASRVQLLRLARGSVVQRILIKDLASLIVRVPPLEDQREIGERFLSFETAIRTHRAVTACLEDLRESDLIVTFAGDTSTRTEPKSRKAVAHGR